MKVAIFGNTAFRGAKADCIVEEYVVSLNIVKKYPNTLASTPKPRDTPIYSLTSSKVSKDKCPAPLKLT